MSEDCWHKSKIIEFLRGKTTEIVDYLIKIHLQNCPTCRRKARSLAKRKKLTMPNLSVA